jgi:hypothetical protein
MHPRRSKTVYPSPCPYCGKTMATRRDGTQDHIVPKAAFAIVPDDVLTIPCCKTCNNKDKSRDDQAFGVYLGLSLGSAVPVQHSLWEKTTQPTLKKNRKMLRRLVVSARAIPLKSPSGIYLGTATAVRSDVPMHNRVVWRIVQGLYYRIYGEVLAPTTPHEVISQKPFTKEFLKTLGAYERGSMGGDQFQYAYFRGTPHYDQISIWFLQFHRHHHVAVVVNGQLLPDIASVASLMAGSVAQV